jgi:hypothetical protein
MIAGMTDYSHQTLDDIVKELEGYLDWLNYVQNLLTTHRETLINNGYWDKVNDDFKGIIAYAMKFYDTCIKEIREILSEMLLEIQQHHITRIQSLYTTADELNLQFGDVWHRDYKPKEYGNENFWLVEQMYAKGRDMSVDMLDLSNLAARLKDFVGKKNYGLQKASLDLKNVHPNIVTLLQRMDDAVKRKDYAGVLHSSASIFETLAKEVVGISSVQNQTLKSFFERYRKDSGLPDEVLNYILSVYDSRSSVPLAGHGHTTIPQISLETAIILSEMTKAFVSIEYKLKGNES